MLEATITIKAPPDLSEEVMKQIDMGMDDLADYIFDKSQDAVPVDIGMLKKSGHVEHEYLDKSIEYDSPYAAFVEFGTAPHFPPVEPLIAWARHHGVPNAEAMGWALARKIAAHGTKAQPFLRPAYDDGKVRAEEIIGRRLD